MWHHWEPNCLKDIQILLGINWEDFVFVRTYRNPQDTLESYKGRALSPKHGEDYYVECLATFAAHNMKFPMPIGIPIDGSNATKTKWAMEVFRRCEVMPSEEALDYMKSWEKIGSQHDEELPAKAIKQSIHRGRVEVWHTK